MINSLKCSQIYDYIEQQLKENCPKSMNESIEINVALGMLIIFLIFTPTDVDELHRAELNVLGKSYDLKEVGKLKQTIFPSQLYCCHRQKYL